MVTVRMIDKYTFEEIAKHAGVIESVIRLTVSADGKTASYVYEDKQKDVTTRGKLYKKL